MRERFLFVLNILSRPMIVIGGAIVIGIAVIGFTWYSTSISPSGNFVSVAIGPITEEVDISGVVKAAHSTDLAFQTSGSVASVRVHVGDHVEAGQTLITLENTSQSAAVALAKANLEIQLAKLAALNAGTRSEQISIDQTAVTQTKLALESALSSAYANADDAVHAKADQVFTNTGSMNAQLAVLVPDETLANRVQAERVTLNPLFSSWQVALVSPSGSQDITNLSETNLRTIMVFLNDLTAALAEALPNGPISAVTLAGYQVNVNAGRLNVSGALSTLISADAAYEAAVGTLALAQAGATKNDIDVQKAAVNAAQASVAAAEALYAQTTIVAPVSGTITAQNANLGETVIPGTPLVSMITDGKYQVSAQIPEIDVGKIKVGDTVDITLIAYPDVTFAATVTTVDPAASMNSGIASYGIKVTFLNNDQRLKPGLSANLRIITKTKSAALLVPTSAIITNGSQEFVYVKNTKNVARTPVTVGIESANGMTEIISGLSAGDQVLTFGTQAIQ